MKQTFRIFLIVLMLPLVFILSGCGTFNDFDSDDLPIIPTGPEITVEPGIGTDTSAFTHILNTGTIAAVDTENKTITLSDGEVLSYDHRTITNEWYMTFNAEFNQEKQIFKITEIKAIDLITIGNDNVLGLTDVSNKEYSYKVSEVTGNLIRIADTYFYFDDALSFTDNTDPNIQALLLSNLINPEYNLLTIGSEIKYYADASNRLVSVSRGV